LNFDKLDGTDIRQIFNIDTKTSGLESLLTTEQTSEAVTFVCDIGDRLLAGGCSDPSANGRIVEDRGVFTGAQGWRLKLESTDGDDAEVTHHVGCYDFPPLHAANR